MTDNKRIIGICLSKIEDDFRTDFLYFAYLNAVKTNSKLIVFNSPRDLYYGDSNDEGSKTIFGSINYEMLDALVILDECFYDRETVSQIINKASSADVPVVLVHGKDENCYSIVTDYTESYKDMLRHLFGKHGVRHPVFIGGRKTGDAQTPIRLGCFKDVLTEYGIAYTDDMLFYGEYWEQPTKVAVRELLSRPGDLPDAIVCANDTMAMTVCEELAANGRKVPDDIKVTGFDGLISAEYFMPRLTTCKEDIGELADLTFSLIDGAVSGRIGKGVFAENYVPFFSESCCKDCESNIDYRKRAQELFWQNYITRNHEGHVYKWVDSVLDSDGLNTLSVALRDYILPNSSVCLNETFIMTALGKNYDRSKDYSFNEYIVISSMSVDYSNGRQGRFPAAEMVPDLDTWLSDDSMCILTPIFVKEESCGYYAVKTDDIRVTAQQLFRVSKTMNIAFGALMNRLIKRNMQSTMLNARYTDQLTGLPNLKGLTKWFDEFSADENNHRKSVMVSVYNIPQYKFIFENYGVDDIEEAVKFVAEALCLANKDNGFIAKTGSDEFIVFNYVDSQEDVSIVIDNAVSVFFGVIEGYNTSSDKDYFLEVNCGCTVADPGWNSSLSSFIKLANAEMYMNKLKAGLTPVLKDEKVQPSIETQQQKDLYSEFTILVEKNLFTYFFQPIIDAKTGEIYAYEALMRTTGGIRMSPLEILDIAKEYNMLYEIEKATMFNVMNRYVRDMDMFANAKVFINTIPGNFLKQKDLEELKQKYGKYISNFVIEITEQDTVSDDELNSIRNLGIIENSEEFRDAEGGQIAVDDYGTGHSNIVNLLRYAPHIIKIDRFLISNIQNDPNKQMFVKSTIEFAKMNNIKVLAEGVETSEEMKTVIEYGVDLIQGYYTARPAQDPIGSIPEDIKNEVIAENLNLSKYDNELLTYVPKKGETVSLYDLAIGRYGCLHLTGGSVKIVGKEGQEFTTEIKIEQNTSVEITLENVNIKAVEEPAIRIGHGSSAVICLKGKNVINKNGIQVPSGSSLRMTGDGDLDIIVKRNGGVGIGNDFDSLYGDISFDNTGTISVIMKIDKGVCIGGGAHSSCSFLNFISGTVNVAPQCVNSLGIGCVKGRTSISVSDKASVNAKCSGKNSTGIGSFEGNADIRNNGRITVVSDGESSAAIGTIGSGTASVTSENGSISAVVHGNRAVCLGSLDGRASVNVFDGFVNVYGEGDRVCGFGSDSGTGTVYISGGTAVVKILSGDICQFGSPDCTTIITGGNVLASEETEVNALNDFGEELHPVHPGGESFAQTIHSSFGEYIYTAFKREDVDDLCVYLPG